MLSIPFFAFWALILFGRRDLGLRGMAFFVTLWTGLLVAFTMFGWPGYAFIAVQAVLDIVLVLIIFGEDIALWGYP